MDMEMERAKARRGLRESEYGMVVLLLPRGMDLEPGTRSAVQGTYSIRIHKYDGDTLSLLLPLQTGKQVEIERQTACVCVCVNVMEID